MSDAEVWLILLQVIRIVDQLPAICRSESEVDGCRLRTYLFQLLYNVSV